MNKMKVYYSGSVAGVSELDLDFPLKLIRYIEKLGARVLDPHVAIPHKGDEYVAAMAAVYGFTFEEWNALEEHERYHHVYTQDIKLVDEATHIITLLNGASHGVGMEIQEALRKPQLGMNKTPILGLVHKSMLNKLSLMLRGASKLHKHFKLQTYSSLEDAQREVHAFLMK